MIFLKVLGRVFRGSLVNVSYSTNVMQAQLTVKLQCRTMEKLTALKLIYPSATKLMDEIVLVVQTYLGDLSFN